MEHFIKTVNIKKQKQKMYFWFFFFGCVSFIVHHPNTYSLSYPFDVSSTSTHSVSGRCKNWRSDTWESELRNNQFYPSLLPPERTINFSTPSLHHWKSGENREKTTEIGISLSTRSEIQLIFCWCLILFLSRCF